MLLRLVHGTGLHTDRLGRLASRIAPVARARSVRIALHQAVQRSDVLAIARCLRAPSLALLPAPLVRQSAELLSRLALLVGAG
jgi:hypothetical protein